MGDVFLPSKLDKRRKEFGFLRFLHVEDKFRLQRQLDNVLIGDLKLWVNLPKFKRDEVVKGRVTRGDFRATTSTDNQRMKGALDIDRSYKRVLTSVQHVPEAHKTPVPSTTPIFLNVPMDDEKLKTFGSCLVGKLKDEFGFLEIQDHLLLEGYSAIRAIPMGEIVFCFCLPPPTVCTMPSIVVVNGGRRVWRLSQTGLLRARQWIAATFGYVLWGSLLTFGVLNSSYQLQENLVPLSLFR